MSTTFLPRRALSAGRVLAWLLGGLLLLLFLCASWVGFRGASAYQHLERIRTGAAESISAVMSNPSGTTSAISSLASDAAAARELTSDPVWEFAERVPWVGPQLAALRTVASSSDQLIRESLLPLAAAAQDASLDSLKPVDGRIDTSVLSDLQNPVRTSAVRAAAAAIAVEQIDTTPLIGVVGSAVGQANGLFSRVADSLDALSRTSQLLPAMLGEDGPRNYLLLIQNNAEWRSLGGISGTAILLHTDAGAVSLLDTQSATGLVRDLTEPIVPLSDDVKDLYGTKPGRYFHNLTMIPDFPVDGPIARTMYRAKTGVEVDGVLAIDPVVLSYLLRAIGPVKLPTGDSLTEGNAVQFLLNEVYLRYPDPATQDSVFSSAAGAVFLGLIEGRGSVEGLLSALGRAGGERRLLIWSANPREQAVLNGTSLAGQLPVTNSRTARFGVFLNDGTGSKMSYYIRPDVSIASGTCEPADGNSQRQVTLKATLTSTAPADAATSLPGYITGGGAYGTAPGNASVITNIYLPEGSVLVSAEASDGLPFASDLYEGRHVLTFGTNIPPGESTDITVVVLTPSGPAGAEAIVTPTADAALSPTVIGSCGAP